MISYAASLMFAVGESIVVFTSPPLGGGGYIYGGIQTDKNPLIYKIAIVIDVFGTYWSKPFANEPYVNLTPEGAFVANFVTGGQDNCARKIYLFLVPASFEIPVVTGGGSIPTALQDAAVASTVIDRTSENTREFSWSGQTWVTKDTGPCQWGPGQNYFSSDAVSVDSSNLLHLKLVRDGDRWLCPEIISSKSFGYGLYEFEVVSIPTNLPPELTVGCFIYDDVVQPNHHEIDVEYNTGAIVGDPNNPWQYTVQPYTMGRNRFRMVSPSVHSFLWSPCTVHFESFESSPTYSGLHATYTLQDASDVTDIFWFELGHVGPIEVDIPGTTAVHYDEWWSLIFNIFMRCSLTDLRMKTDLTPSQSWITVMSPGIRDERVHFNVWINGVLPAENTNRVLEVVFKGFKFTPFDTSVLNPRMTLTNAAVSFGTGTKFDLLITAPGK